MVKCEPCSYCGAIHTGSPRGFVGRDHIIPKAKGGKDGWANRSPACRKCDNLKADRSALWMLVRYGYGRCMKVGVMNRPKRITNE